MFFNKKLNDEILKHYFNDNKIGLIDCYRRAADNSEDVNEVAFFLTQAYIFSLETGESVVSNSIFHELETMERI